MSLEEEVNEVEATTRDILVTPHRTPNPIITINCGGQLFQTFRETLVNNSEYFRALLAGGFAEGFAEGGGGGGGKAQYFLDMNPKMFALLLDRMRYGVACKLPSGDDRPAALVFAAEFLGVEYRNEDEIELEKEVLQQQQAALEAAQKELEKQTRLALLKEAGLVGFLVMCVDTVSNNCLARVMDLSEDGTQYFIHYEHFTTNQYDEWVPKDSPRISRNIQRCNCRGSVCPDSSHLRGGTYSIVVNNTAGTATATIPTSHSYYINYLNGAATTTTRTLFRP